MTSDPQCRTILVVDDDLDIRTLTKRFLEAAGWTVVTASDGAEGLRVYEEHQSSVALLLTDVRMPNMNGFELTDRVLGIDSRLPVLFMSGEDWSTYPGLECVPKPFQFSELLDRISRVLTVNTHSKTTTSAA
jgi:DNA-binding response OmpR family regulator